MLFQVVLLLWSVFTPTNGQGCLPIGTTGCSPNPIYNSLCCSNAYCNAAASCQPCIPLGSPNVCSVTAQDSRRCCTGLSCVAQRCVVGVATTTRGPTTTLPPNCLSAGTLGCNPNPAGQPQCCPNAYCNAALSCQSCIAFGNTSICSPTAQDSRRCCNNLTCFNGLCLPSSVVPTTPPLTSTTATSTATTTATTATTAITTTTATTGTTTAPCIAFGNFSTCSPTAQDSTRCCVNLTCSNGLCLPSILFTTTPAPTSTITTGTTTAPCIAFGNFSTCSPTAQDSTRCCVNLTCSNGLCLPSSLFTTTPEPTSTTATTPATTGTTTAPCIAFGNSSICSPTAMDSRRCCQNLICYNGLCLPDYLFSTTTTPASCAAFTQPCVNVANSPMSCCAGNYCMFGFCVPISSLMCQYQEGQSCATQFCCPPYTCTNSICVSTIVRTTA